MKTSCDGSNICLTWLSCRCFSVYKKKSVCVDLSSDPLRRLLHLVSSGGRERMITPHKLKNKIFVSHIYDGGDCFYFLFEVLFLWFWLCSLKPWLTFTVMMDVCIAIHILFPFSGYFEIHLRLTLISHNIMTIIGLSCASKTVLILIREWT